MTYGDEEEARVRAKEAACDEITESLRRLRKAIQKKTGKNVVLVAIDRLCQDVNEGPYTHAGKFFVCNLAHHLLEEVQNEYDLDDLLYWLGLVDGIERLCEVAEERL